MSELRPSQRKYIRSYLGSPGRVGSCSWLDTQWKYFAWDVIITASHFTQASYRARNADSLFNWNSKYFKSGYRSEFQIKLKIRAQTGSNRELIIPFYRKNVKVCAAIALDSHILRTPQSEQFLFITVEMSHKEVSSQTLSRWVKSMLTNSSVDTQLFLVHSTHHASTLATASKGINIDSIKRAAWTVMSQTCEILSSTLRKNSNKNYRSSPVFL